VKPSFGKKSSISQCLSPQNYFVYYFTCSYPIYRASVFNSLLDQQCSTLDDLYLSHFTVENNELLKLPVFPVLTGLALDCPYFEMVPNCQERFPKLTSLDFSNLDGVEVKRIFGPRSINTSVTCLDLPTENFGNLHDMLGLVSLYFPNLMKLSTVYVTNRSALQALKIIFQTMPNLEELHILLDEEEQSLGNVDSVLTGIPEYMCDSWYGEPFMEEIEYAEFQAEPNLTSLKSMWTKVPRETGPLI